MWPTNSDPQHGSFIKAHVQASKNLGNQIAVVFFGNKPIANQEIKTFHTPCRKGPSGWKVKLDYVIKAIKYLGGCELLHIHGLCGYSVYNNSFKIDIRKNSSFCSYRAPESLVSYDTFGS
jgi:hypothetical protein